MLEDCALIMEHTYGGTWSQASTRERVVLEELCTAGLRDPDQYKEEYDMISIMYLLR